MRRRIVFGRSGMAGMLLAVAVLSGCAPPRGGWDEGLLDADPTLLAGLRGHRLGDMLPFPAPEPGGEGLALVVCRWSLERGVPLRLPADGGRAEQGAAAARAIEASVPGLRFTRGGDRGAEQSGRAPRGIDVVDVSEEAVEAGAGPTGLGDTLAVCDVSARGAGGGARGVMEHAEIRLRDVRTDGLGRPVPVTAEEATGALMHELAHALGFAGHPVVGGSILVLREDRIRAAGRRALAGEAWRDASLEALYRLEPGRVLGRRPWTQRSREWMDRLIARLGPPEAGQWSGPRASVGDREARLEWRGARGRRLRLRLPGWRRQLERGGALAAIPDRATRAWLLEASEAGRPEPSTPRASDPADEPAR